MTTTFANLQIFLSVKIFKSRLWIIADYDSWVKNMGVWVVTVNKLF